MDLYLQGGEETLPPKAVIFASDADAWFALDYRLDEQSPRVLHWSEYEEEPIELSGSFREFLEKLSKL